jgi:16S rRNA (guanine966-N2)-methyltransferase
MRIIAGELRGRRVAAPPGRGTRPMLDRVREALFATLSPWMEGAQVLDLFAGSGALGFEALSRGAAHVRAVERMPPVLDLLRRNARELGLEERVTSVRNDALRTEAWGSRGSFDVVFCDPPYPLLDARASRAAVLAAVHELVRTMLASEGILVLHTALRALRAAELEPDLAAVERDYGSSALWYVQRAADAGTSESPGFEPSTQEGRGEP